LVNENYVRDPFLVADWRTEGAMVPAQQFFTMLANSLYRADQPGGMTFITDRAQFPDLDGIQPEDLIDPNVNIARVVYSRGWGQDGLAEALLYFAQDECGGYSWHGLVFAREGFLAAAPAAITIQDNLDCATVTESDALDWVICNVRDGLRSGNLGALPSFMTDPFALGYWRSEWTSPTPGEAVEELQLYRLPVDKSRLVFTRDASQFPGLDGQPVAGMLGPDAQVADVVYSQGWGQDGAGAALLFFTVTPNGKYRLAGILIDQNHFE
jgi:hypothetical protein